MGLILLMLIRCTIVRNARQEVRTRWLDIGGFRFQPTELSKVIIILFFAKFFMDHEDDIEYFQSVWQKQLLLLAVPLAADLCTAGYEKYHYGNY